MAIVKMKRLRLFGMASDQSSLLRKLRKLGCVQLSRPQLPDPAPPFLLPPDGRGLDKAAGEMNALTEALAVLKREAPQKDKLLRARPTVAESQFFDDARYRSALSTAEDINSAAREVNTLQAQLGKLRAQRAALAPWLELAVPLDLTPPKDVSVLFGGLPLRTERDAFTAALDAVTDLYTVEWAGQDRELQYLLLLCHNSALEAVQPVLLEQNFSRLNLRDCSGTALENDRRLEGELEALERQLEDVRGRIAAAGPQRDELRLAWDRCQQELNLERAREDLLGTPSAFYLEGWFPADREDALKDLLGEYTVCFETAEPTVDEYPEVPIKLKNNPVARSMNTITEMYSMPAYDGIDPNPLMAPFFILFFGIMMADMAYGLLMILGSAIYLKKARPKNRAFMEMIFWCGISTFIVGALTGGFFGDFIPQLMKIIDPQSTFQMPYLFTPLTDTIAILLGSLVLGAIQVFTGMLISVIKKIKDGQFVDALFDEITWWIIIAGGVLAFLGLGSIAGVPVVLIAGILMLAVGGTRKSKGIGKAASFVGLVYNGVTGFFSDILSYMRLMALMLAGSVIAQVFNTLGSVFGNVVVFVIISMIGNALNLALNLLGCYVHDLRLQCLEFFGRFYKEGGKPFRPLKLDTNYVEIIKEEH